MYTRYLVCALALGFGVQPIESSDIDPTTLIATGIATIGCLTGYSIYVYKQHQDQQNAENAIKNFQSALNEVQQKNRSLINAWNTQYQSHPQRIQALGATSDATFDAKRKETEGDMLKLDSAYNNAANQEKLDQYPKLQQKLAEVKPQYHHTRNNLEAIHTFLRNHKFQLKAHDTLYRTNHLIRYYHEPNSAQLVSRFTSRNIGWPRVHAVEYMQNSIRDLDTTATHLYEEKSTRQSCPDAAAYSDHLLQWMQSVRDNLEEICQSLSMSPEYDKERELYRNYKQQEEIKNTYQRWVDTEQQRKQEEERNRKATEKQTEALERHRREIKRAQELYQELLRRGYYELPYIRTELANTIRELDNIENRYTRGDRSISLDDIKDIKRRLDTIRARMPADTHDDLNISFHINLNRN